MRGIKRILAGQVVVTKNVWWGLGVSAIFCSTAVIFILYVFICALINTKGGLTDTQFKIVFPIVFLGGYVAVALLFSINEWAKKEYNYVHLYLPVVAAGRVVRIGNSEYVDVREKQLVVVAVRHYAKFIGEGDRFCVVDVITFDDGTDYTECLGERELWKTYYRPEPIVPDATVGDRWKRCYGKRITRDYSLCAEEAMNLERLYP